MKGDNEVKNAAAERPFISFQLSLIVVSIFPWELP